MAEKLATHAWLIWREGKEGQPVFLGLYESEEVAAEEIKELQKLPEMSQHLWHTKCVLFIGWGFIAESGRVLRNEPISNPSKETH